MKSIIQHMGFSTKKLGELKHYKSWKDLVSLSFLVKTTVVVASILVIIGIGKWAAALIPQTTNIITRATAQVVSRQIGEEMTKDEFGNINVLIAGYAGEDYRGSMLTDTIMVASFNPELGAVTFISIPRDLYINYGEGRTGKINGLFWNAYLANNKDKNLAIELLAKKAGEITGLEVPYYVMVDFDGFTKFIDDIGGIDVYVKQALYDDQYPGPNDSYTVFQVNQGDQHFDGATALKYARSRKTTSDFSRAYRQQQIIESTAKKIMSQISITKIDYLKETYDKGMKIFFTNVSMKNLLGMVQYLDKEKHFFSFVLTAECDTRYFNTAEPGCSLYFVNKELFGGASGMLPDGATPTNISYYRKIHDLTFWIAHNQGYLVENAPIYIYNGINKEAAKAQGYNVNGVAGQLAIDLKLKGFNVQDTLNAPAYVTETKIYVPETGLYQITLDTLKAFVDYASIEVSSEYASGAISIVLGDDYLSKL